ncbi:MAG: hypothetical protein K2K86_04525 [Muribaculaceae bacterium]|nr:hypothetical protein [Muribaculaceae bacterium]
MAKINVSQFAILADNAPEDGLSYTVGINFGGAPDARRVACEFSIEFDHGEKALLKLAVFCEFDIMAADWDERVNAGILTLTKSELGLFANQAVGVARGILFCKTEGTPFGRFIVPPINLETLISEDLNITI